MAFLVGKIDILKKRPSRIVTKVCSSSIDVFDTYLNSKLRGWRTKVFPDLFLALTQVKEMESPAFRSMINCFTGPENI
jgi:hypothetical protein